MKNAWILVLVTALVLASLNVNAMGFSSALNTVLITQNPYPAEPGRNLNIEVQIQNTGYSESGSTDVEIIIKEPFTLLPGEDAKKTFANIAANEFVIVSYNLHVDESTTSGDYEIDISMCPSETQGACITGTIVINVQGEAELILDSMETAPSRIDPGGTANLILKIKNIGTGVAKRLNIELNSSHDELIPVLAKGSAYVGDLAPGQMKTVELELSVGGDAEDKTYTVTMEADYREENNTAVEKKFFVGVPVTGSIVLDIITIEPSYERDRLKIEIANKGTSEAKSLEAKLIVGDEAVGIDYVSSLKANKKTTFDFPLVLQGTGQLVINYTGPGIEKNQATKDIVLDFESPANGDGTTTLIIVIVIVVIVYFSYRKFIKKKR